MKFTHSISRRPKIEKAYRCAYFVLFVSYSLSASALSIRTESWGEEVLLHDGRMIKVTREVNYTFQLFYGDGGSPGMFGSWPDQHLLRFKHPDTHKTIEWKGEQYFDPVLLDIVDSVPYLVVHGRPNKDTEKTYGCPELPYIFLKYEKGFWGKWAPVPVEQAPRELLDANLSPRYPDFPRTPYKYSENVHQLNEGKSTRNLTRDGVLENIQKVQQSSRGSFQAKIPRNYDDWYSIYKDSERYERKRGDCRPDPTLPLPTKKSEASKQQIIEAGLKAQIVNAVIESYSEDAEMVTPESFYNSKGGWTGHGYLSGRCKGIVKTIAPIREYFGRGGWHLIGSKLVLQPGSELPFQQDNLKEFQAPNLPQLTTCYENIIYVVSKDVENKESLVVYRFTNSGEVIDAIRVSLPDTDKFGKGRRDIWEVIPMGDNFIIALADYTYTATANQGGTINKKQTYITKLPKYYPPAITLSADNQTADRVGQSTKTFRDCPVCPEMVLVPGREYAIGKYEVTQAEWKAITGKANHDYGKQLIADDMPALYIDLRRTHDFISKLNKETGGNYRLPTEEEWEYACHGGSKDEYCGGNDVASVAWNSQNSDGLAHVVGKKQPNGYGIYDMSGNVWEWVSGCWKGDCNLTILRGGSYLDHPLRAKAAYIYGKKRGAMNIGFRVVRPIQ